jgi:hypothetical protein
MAEIWFGVGDHEFQMDLREPGITLVIPKPGVLLYNDEPLQPSDDDDEETWGFDLAPRDRGALFSASRVWEYVATFIWEDPNTQDELECNLKLSVCREDVNVWGVCIYPESGNGHIIVLPGEVSGALEEAYSALPPEGWAKTPYVLRGGEEEVV